MGSSKMVEGWPQVLDSNWWFLKLHLPLNNWRADLPIRRNSQSQTDFLGEACTLTLISSMVFTPFPGIEARQSVVKADHSGSEPEPTC